MELSETVITGHVGTGLGKVDVGYAEVVAGTAEVKGLEWPLGFEGFMELPERMVDAWLEAVYELNPHWRPGWAEKEEKKALTSGTSG